MKLHFEIKQIKTDDTYAIRQTILRPGKAIDTCKFTGDSHSSTFHLGLYYKNELAGIASYMLNSNERFSDKLQYQLRGMAILPEFRGCQFGKHLLEEAENILNNKNINLIWFNAREIAVNFYKRNTYNILGDYFNIEGVGKHITMYKRINEHTNNNNFL